MSEQLDQKELDEIRDRASRATEGPWKISGATVVWSPSGKAVVCAASMPRPASGLVEYHEVELGDLEEPASNAEYIAEIDRLRASRELKGVDGFATVDVKGKIILGSIRETMEQVRLSAGECMPFPVRVSRLRTAGGT